MCRKSMWNFFRCLCRALSKISKKSISNDSKRRKFCLKYISRGSILAIIIIQQNLQIYYFLLFLQKLGM